MARASAAAVKRLSVLAPERRRVVEVATGAELIAAMAPNTRFVCTAPIVLASALDDIPGSVTIQATAIRKGFASGAAMIQTSDGASAGFRLECDFVELQDSVGTGRLVVCLDEATVVGYTQAFCEVGTYSYHSGASGSAIEFVGPSFFKIEGGIPDAGGAGDLVHIGGGTGHRGTVRNPHSWDDCLGVFPREPLFVWGNRSVDDVDVTVIGGVSERARLIAVGVPETTAFDTADCSVTNVTVRHEGTGVAFDSGALAATNQGVIMTLNNVTRASGEVSNITITAGDLDGSGNCDHALAARNSSNVTITAASATGFTAAQTANVNSTNTTLAVG